MLRLILDSNVYSIIAKDIESIELFDPTVFCALEGDSLGVTGADCAHIQESDIVIVNAEKSLGAGTAIELVIAKYLKKPVITVLPKDSHHRRSNVNFEGRLVADWIHPFIDTFSDVVIEKPHQVKHALQQLQTLSIKDASIIHEAIMYAKEILLQKNSNRA